MWPEHKIKSSSKWVGLKSWLGVELPKLKINFDKCCQMYLCNPTIPMALNLTRPIMAGSCPPRACSEISALLKAVYSSPCTDAKHLQLKECGVLNCHEVTFVNLVLCKSLPYWDCNQCTLSLKWGLLLK